MSKTFWLNAPVRQLSVANPLNNKSSKIPRGIILGAGFSTPIEEGEDIYFEGMTHTDNEEGLKNDINIAADVEVDYDKYIAYLHSILVDASNEVTAIINRTISVLTSPIAIGGLTYEGGSFQIAGKNGGLIKFIKVWR
jgi:hypothetical protein